MQLLNLTMLLLCLRDWEVSAAVLGCPQTRRNGTENSRLARLLNITKVCCCLLLCAAVCCCWPSCQVTLLDSLRKRCDFLQEAARRLGE
jgi:hypothetical protein